jgi:uncharacterized membrane protein
MRPTAGLRRALIEARYSLWFEPTLIMAVAVALGLLLPWVDRSLPVSLQRSDSWARWVAVSAGGARATLSTSATALATILAISVTATMVVIQLASASYTARLLRRFLGDRPIRLVLGLLTGSVLYLIMVLGAVRSGAEGPEFVPVVSVLLSRALTVACLATLIVFVHHTARSVQAGTVVSRLAGDALPYFRALHRKPSHPASALPPAPPNSDPCVITSAATGYVQVVAEEQILAALPPQARCVRVDASPGRFLLPGVPLVSVWSADGTAMPAPGEEAEERVRGAFATGRQRTSDEDPSFAVRQLVDVATKALSPAVNDPTTAVMVLNELAVIAHHAALANGLGGWTASVAGERLLWRWQFGLHDVLDGLTEVTDAGRGQARVLVRALESLALLRGATAEPAAQRMLRDAAARVVEMTEHAALARAQRAELTRLFERWGPDEPRA